MKQNSGIVLKSIIVVALVGALSLHVLSPAKGAGNTPVYVLGVSNPTDPLIVDLQSLTSSVTILSSVAGLTTINLGSILYIDGSWLASTSSTNPTILPTIVQTVLAGVPSVVVRGDPSILANSISGLLKFQNPGLPLIAEGVQVSGTLTGGTRQGAVLRVISGFDYSVAAEFQWAIQLLQSSPTTILAPIGGSLEHSTRAAVVPQDGTGPFWTRILRGSVDTGDHFKPYGHINTTFLIYELQNSGSANSKWFNIFTNQTVTPGASIPGYNMTYRNYLETTSAHPNNQTTNIFVNNGPATQTSSGPLTVTYSIGTTAGSFNDTVTSTQTMSYFLKNANVTNTSASPNVGWTHTIAGGTSAGKLTLQFVPGWTDEVSQQYPMNVSGDLVTTFASFSNSNTPQTLSPPNDVSFQIFGG